MLALIPSRLPSMAWHSTCSILLIGLNTFRWQSHHLVKSWATVSTRGKESHRTGMAVLVVPFNGCKLRVCLEY